MLTLNLAVDLGTSSMVAKTAKKGIVVDEPSVIAINPTSNKVIGVGRQVYQMVGKEHDQIKIVHPLENGVVSNYDLTHVLVKHLFKTAGKGFLVKPRVIACVPCSVTTIEAKTLIEVFTNIGARDVRLIPEPVAAALGIGLDTQKPIGNLVVNIGGGTTDIAVISLGGIVTYASSLCAGNAFDEVIIKYIKDTYSLVIGFQTAEKIKKSINIFSENSAKTIEIKGHSFVSGLPEQISINPSEIAPTLIKVAEETVLCIRSVIESTPPELVGDIQENGIYLTGGGALLGGLAEYIKSQIGVAVKVPENPAHCSISGVLAAFDYNESDFIGFYTPDAVKAKHKAHADFT